MRASLALVVLTLGRPVTALFEDQAGKIDWGRQNLGRTTSALFHTASGQRLALVSTEAGVVAGVDVRTGETSWRRVLPEGESVSELVPFGKSGALSVGIARREGGSVGSVRMWSPLGALTWDAIVADVGGERAPAIAVGESAVYIGSGGTVVALQAATGAELWRWRAAADRGASLAIVQLVARLTAEGGMGSLHALAVTEKPGAAPTLVAYGLSPADGKQVERHELRSSEAVAPAEEVRK
jgi:outer membrane protein assembly factor BamB